MKENLTKADVTPDVIAGVTELLARMTIAQVTREEVDKVQSAVLQDIALYDDLMATHQEREPERVYNPGQTYLSQDEPALKRYYAATDAALRAKGLKPDDMATEYCPALVAEHNETKAEWALLDAAAEMLELDFDGQELNSRLLCHKNGLERRQEFLDILIKLVVNL